MDDQRVVSFTQMKDGTKEDYELLERLEKSYVAGQAARIMAELERQATDNYSGYQVPRLVHSLQSATRARREGADIDWIVGALLHDIGDGLSPVNHDRYAAEILRPFLREEVTWTVEVHGVFQLYYYAEHYGWDPEARQKYKDHPCYRSCVDFCERWDQASFDPAYPTDSLESFRPEVEEVFARKPWDPAHLQPGVVKGLP